MNPTETKRFNELYQQHLRMLNLRGKSLKTIDTYARAVRRISAYFDCCPDQLTLEQREHYFSDLVASHSWSTVKIDRNALKIQLTFWPLRKPGDLARPGETARSIRGVILRTPKKYLHIQRPCQLLTGSSNYRIR